MKRDFASEPIPHSPKGLGGIVSGRDRCNTCDAPLAADEKSCSECGTTSTPKIADRFETKGA